MPEAKKDSRGFWYDAGGGEAIGDGGFWTGGAAEGLLEAGAAWVPEEEVKDGGADGPG